MVPHDAQNTVALVVMLFLGVAAIFFCFALAAICYRQDVLAAGGKTQEISPPLLLCGLDSGF